MLSIETDVSRNTRADRKHEPFPNLGPMPLPRLQEPRRCIRGREAIGTEHTGRSGNASRLAGTLTFAQIC